MKISEFVGEGEVKEGFWFFWYIVYAYKGRRGGGNGSKWIGFERGGGWKWI